MQGGEPVSSDRTRCGAGAHSLARSPGMRTGTVLFSARMLRAVLRFVLLCGVALVAAPMILASLYVDQRGVALNGRVYSKSEYLRMNQGSWTRTSEVSFEYTLPETGGVSFFNVDMAPEKYDEYHIGQAVAVHYLRREDVPKWPGADAMWQMRILPHVRLAEQRAFAGIAALMTPRVELGAGVVVLMALLLWVWRRSRLPGFSWAMGAVILCGVIALLFYDFPRPTPAPVGETRTASGTVKSLRRIDRLINASRSRGLTAHQPVDVVGIEFVPQGFRDPVLAVDLVDRGSVQSLAEGARVDVEYEAARPRTAWLRSATRTFARRNLVGMGEDVVLYIGVLIAGLLLFQFLWQRRPTRRGL